MFLNGSGYWSCSDGSGLGSGMPVRVSGLLETMEEDETKLLLLRQKLLNSGDAEVDDD